jgi:hypothetical protein
LAENPASTVLKLFRPDISCSASVRNRRWLYDLGMQTNCSATLVEKPTLVLQSSSPSHSRERREGGTRSWPRVASPPAPHTAAAPLWSIAKVSLVSCERLEGAAWLALGLSAAAVLLWGFLSLLA